MKSVLIYIIYTLLNIICSEKNLLIKSKLEQNEIFMSLFQNFTNLTTNHKYLENITQDFYINIDEYMIDKYKLNNEKYDIENRLIKLNKFSQKDFFTYHLINVRPLSKHDNGFFSNIAILIIHINGIKIYDLYSNLLCEFDFDFRIDNIYSLGDESIFYLLTDNKTNIRKIYLSNRKVKNGNITTDSGQKVIVTSYKENEMNYDYSLNYKNSLAKTNWSIDYLDNYKSNDTIDYIKPYIYKGLKNLFISSGKKITVLNEELSFTNMKFNIDFDISQGLFLINKNYGYMIDQRIKVSSFEHNDIHECKLEKNLTSPIARFIYDTYNHLVYAILENGNLVFITLFHDDQCIITRKHDIGLKVENIDDIKLELIRKDFIIKNRNTFYFIDIIDIENNFNYKKIEIEENCDQKKGIHDKLVSLKTLPNNYYILFENCGSLILYEITGTSSKIKGTEDFNYNFKIPVLFIAIIVIFLFQFYKKRTNHTEDKENIKEDLIKKIKEMNMDDEYLDEENESDEDIDNETIEQYLKNKKNN